MLTDTQIEILMDIANAGTHKGLVSQARQMYGGILAVRPGYAPAIIGTAVSHIVVNQFDEAENLLKNVVLAQNPDDEDAQAMLGLSYLLRHRPDEAKSILHPLASGSGTAARLAQELLKVELV